jgi:hypothetical protein
MKINTLRKLTSETLKAYSINRNFKYEVTKDVNENDVIYMRKKYIYYSYY